MNLDEVYERTIQRIADESHPDRMSAREAREYYERLASWLDGSIEAMEDEAADAPEDL